MSDRADNSSVDIEGLWHTRLAHDEDPPQEWKVPFLGLSAYMFFSLLGFFLGNSSLFNVLGALAFMYILALGNFRKLLRISADPTVLLALAIAVHILFVNIINFETSDFRIAAKLSAIFVVYVLIFSYRFVPMNLSEYRFKLMALVAVPLAVSYVTIGMPGLSSPLEGRISGGVLVVPSGLSQISFIMLFLINDEDKLWVKLLAHGVVILFLALSAAIGMMLGYLVALAFKHWRVIIYPKVMFFVAVMMIAVTITIIALDVDLSKVYFIKRFLSQHELVFEKYDYAISGSEINYGKIISSNREYSQSTSGLWRVSFWVSLLKDYARGDLVHQVMGRGASYSNKNFGREPHNEYIRVLLEYGFLGFLLFSAFTLVALWRFDSRYRYLLVMLMVTAASSNDMDNSFYMIMVMCMLVSCQIVRDPQREELDHGSLREEYGRG